MEEIISFPTFQEALNLKKEEKAIWREDFDINQKWRASDWKIWGIIFNIPTKNKSSKEIRSEIEDLLELGKFLKIYYILVNIV